MLKDFLKHIKAIQQIRTPSLEAQILAVDGLLEDWWGYSVDNAVGKSYKEWIYVEDLHIFESALRERLPKKGSYILHYRIKKSDGTLTWVREQANLIEHDRQQYVQSMISPASKAYVQNHIDAQKYQAIANISSEAIVIYENDKIIDVNQTFEKMFGKEAQEVIGQDPLRQITSDKSLATFYDLQKKLVQYPDQAHVRELQLFRKDGTAFWAKVKGQAIEVANRQLQVFSYLDLTEIRKVNQALLNSKERYKRLAEASNEGIIIHNKGIIIEVNHKIGEILGYQPEEIGRLKGKALMDFLEQNQQNVIEAFLKENELNPYLKRSATVPVKNLKGEQLFVNIVGSAIDIDGKCYRYVTIRDVSEEYKAQKALENSQKRYKQLSELTKELILIHDLEGNILEANKALCEFTGLSTEQLLQKKTIDIVAPQVVEKYQLNQEKLNLHYQQTPKDSGIQQMLNHHGELRIIEYREQNFKKDALSLRYVVMNDITAMHQAKQHLVDSRNKYKMLADITREAIVIQDLQGVIIEVNEAYCKLFKTSANYIIGKSGLEFVPQDELENYFQFVQKNALHSEINREQNIALTSLHFQNSQQERFIAEAHLNYITVDNQLLRYTVIRDISDAVKTQSLLQQSNAKYKRLANVTREAIIIHKDQQIIELNERAVELFGWKTAELIGQDIKDLISPQYLPKPQEKVSGQQFQRAYLQRSDGKNFVAELLESQLDVDSGQLGYLVIRDISAQIHYEQRIEELVYDLSEKNKQLNCLFEISRLASNQSVHLEQLIERALEIIPNSWQYAELCEAKLVYGNKSWSTASYQDTEWCLNAELKINGKVQGSLSVCYLSLCPSADYGPFLKAEVDLIDALAIQISTLIEKRLSEDRMIASVLEAEDRERTRIAKELHDSLGQLLMAISLNLESLKKDMNLLSDKNQLKLTNALNYLSSAIQESRHISHNLMPKAINDYGYILAIQSMIEGLQAVEDVNFQFYNNLNEERLSSNIELSLFRITQEAITNILKHADAKNITIQLMKYSDMLLLTIEDDGEGFDYKLKQEKDRNFGLESIQNRANSISAVLTIESKKGYGTTIMVEVPI